MRRCSGCFELVNNGIEVCPFCGYVAGSPAESSLYLAPGTMLSGRYIIGKKLDLDKDRIVYAAWDNISSIKVIIKEYLPFKYASRALGSNKVEPYNAKEKALFDKGFGEFVDEAKRLYQTGSGAKLFDCIAENGTAYMIFEYVQNSHREVFAQQVPEKVPQPVQKPEAKPAKPAKPAAPKKAAKASSKKKAESKPPITVLTAEKKDNHSYRVKRRISLIPLWVKIVVPLVLVICGAFVTLVCTGIIKFKKETEEITDTSVSETETTVTEETTEPVETKPVFVVTGDNVMTFKGHTYACLSDAKTWEEAKEQCEKMQGHLVIISTQEENDAVWAYAKSLGNKSVFIGLSDSEKEGEWKWVNGDPVQYSHWNGGEPNASSDDEDYAEFSFRVEGGFWNDSRYETHFEDAVTSYICEWDGYDYRIIERPLTTEQAETAFRYYMTDLISGNEIGQDDSLAWGIVRSEEEFCVFRYVINKTKEVVFYMDMQYGLTTSIVYEQVEKETIITGGEFDFNAWDYLDNADEYKIETETTDLQTYLGTNIHEAAKAIGNLGDVQQKSVTYYENDKMTIETDMTEGSTEVACIKILSNPESYSVYGIVPGMSFKEASKYLMISGAAQLTHQEAAAFFFIMKDGNTVALTLDADNNVQSIILRRENK